MLTHEQNDFLTRGGARYTHGKLAAPLLDSVSACLGIARSRLRAGAGQSPVLALDRVSRQRRQAGSDRRVMRAPRRVAVVWPQ